MNDDLIMQEQLSALADGELTADELTAALAYAESETGQQAWQLYHLVGDVLRSPELAHHSQHDVLSGLRSRLAQEGPPLGQAAPVLAPGVLQQVVPVQGELAWGNGAQQPTLAGNTAANASVFRWKMAAGFASVAAVAAIGWGAMLGSQPGLMGGQGPALAMVSPQAAPGQGPALGLAPLNATAQSSSVVAVTGPYGQSVMLRDPRLDELLAAQPQQGATATLQMPAGFLRNANFAATRSPQR